MSGYPAGAEFDSRAPYNKKSWGDCPACEGQGSLECQTCSVIPNDVIGVCDDCNGDNYITCHICEGSGEKTQEQINDERESWEEDTRERF